MQLSDITETTELYAVPDETKDSRYYLFTAVELEEFMKSEDRDPLAPVYLVSSDAFDDKRIKLKLKVTDLT